MRVTAIFPPGFLSYFSRRRGLADTSRGYGKKSAAEARIPDGGGTHVRANRPSGAHVTGAVSQAHS